MDHTLQYVIFDVEDSWWIIYAGKDIRYTTDLNKATLFGSRAEAIKISNLNPYLGVITLDEAILNNVMEL
jgi:hypothetical protein